jgi:hypothetical protein
MFTYTDLFHDYTKLYQNTEYTIIKLLYIHSKTTKTTDQESTEPPSKHVSSKYLICFKKTFFVSKGMRSGCKTLKQTLENYVPSCAATFDPP